MPPNPTIDTTTTAVSPPATTTTSTVAHLDTSAPAINASPVEIDGTPTTSPTTQNKTDFATLRGYKGGCGAGVPQRSCSAGSSPDHLAREEEVLEEFGLGGGAGGGENRAALLQLRKRDPAVLVDIPQGPSVEDFAAAGLMSPEAEEKEAGMAS